MARGERTRARNHPFPLRAVLVVALIVSLGCSPARLSEAIAVLDDIGSGAGPSTLKASVPRPERRPLSFAVAGRQRSGDLYVPGREVRAGMVLVPGAARTGKDDPRLIAFAETFARAGFEVLVPEVPRMRALQVTSADARLLADAAIMMAERNSGRPIGMTAISFAAGPAVLALFEPGVESRVDFLISVGGYYDLEAVITYLTTGYFRIAPDARWQYRRPNDYGKWVFIMSNAGRLDDPRDRAGLARMAARKLGDAKADVSDLVALLGPDGLAVYALLANDDPDRVPALLAALPPSVAAEINALDLKRRDLDRLDVQFILVHGRDDPIIPETESIAFAKAAGTGINGPSRAHLYLVDSLHHVDPGAPDFGDTLTLLGAIYRILELRDASPLRTAERRSDAL